ncbi:hypothetical protein [Miltoncostaea oceani]|uniref:hypothetical protein n=1 Tax=Miltoncostaea oceani TaxID=2843216 RepID=UPI001C3E5AA1|nr:hypothetical protein [Miltoncostaea oceani]
MTAPSLTTVRLDSDLDESVNWVTDLGGADGMIETRYVRRRDDYLICYLSSQGGCGRGCRMCALTASRQTRGIDMTVPQIIAQARTVLDHYDGLVADGCPVAQTIHFNFMSRGEVLANPLIRDGADEMLWALTQMSRERGLMPSFKLSTIMPRAMADEDLNRIFGGIPVDFYYSLYSTDPGFRRRWLPDALDHEEALAKLVRYQAASRKVPVIHWAYIEGENDSVADTQAIVAAVNAAGLRCDVNIVRYNPFSAEQGREPALEVIERNAAILAAGIPGARVQIVGRVGFDVKASCGMFVGGRQRQTVG